MNLTRLRMILFFLVVLFITIVFRIFIEICGMKVRILTQQLGRNLSEKAVKKYIRAMRFAIIPNEPKYWQTLKSGFHLVNNSKDIHSSLKEELMKVLLSKGCNLGNVRIIKSSKEIEQEMEQRELQKEKARRETGKKGEIDIQHNLSFLATQGYRILHNVRIQNSIYDQEIDHIVIGTNGLFHIETKNHDGYGKIIIDKHGNWIKEEGGRQFAIKNPLAQVDRHDMAIKEYLSKDFSNVNIPIIPIIAHANENYIIEGQENFPIPVLKSEQLTYFIKNYNAETSISKDLVEKIYLRFSENAINYA
mgnify:CR=1 FL=1